MAQRNSSGRGATATRTSDRPATRPGHAGHLRVGDRPDAGRRHPGAAAPPRSLRDLRAAQAGTGEALARTLRSEGRAGGAARRQHRPARPGAPPRKTGAGRGTAARRVRGTGQGGSGPGTQGHPTAARRPAADLPGQGDSVPGRGAPSRAKAAPAVRAKATAPSRAKTSASSRAKATASSRPGRAALRGRGAKAAPAGGRHRRAVGAVRTGRSTSRSVRSSQLISSPADRPERPGRSLVTTNHEVIRGWAGPGGPSRPPSRAPSGTAGPGVLTFDLPGYRESRRLRQITWDEWFRTFDSAG